MGILSLQALMFATLAFQAGEANVSVLLIDVEYRRNGEPKAKASIRFVEPFLFSCSLSLAGKLHIYGLSNGKEVFLFSAEEWKESGVVNPRGKVTRYSLPREGAPSEVSAAAWRLFMVANGGIPTILDPAGKHRTLFQPAVASSLKRERTETVAGKKYNVYSLTIKDPVEAVQELYFDRDDDVLSKITIRGEGMPYDEIIVKRKTSTVVRNDKLDSMFISIPKDASIEDQPVRKGRN